MEQGSLLLIYLWTLHGPPSFLWCHRRAVSTSGTLALGNVVLGSPRSQRVGLGLRPGLLLCEATAGDAGFLISLQIVMVFMEYFR